MEWRWDDNDGVWCVVGGKGVTDTRLMELNYGQTDRHCGLLPD